MRASVPRRRPRLALPAAWCACARARARPALSRSSWRHRARVCERETVEETCAVAVAAGPFANRSLAASRSRSCSLAGHALDRGGYGEVAEAKN